MACTGSWQDVEVTSGEGEEGLRLGWSVAQFVVAYGVRLRFQSVSYAGKKWRIARDLEKGWTPVGGADQTEVRIAMG